MYSVPISQYPNNKDWNKKVFSTPSIPGGKKNTLSNLRKLLLEIQNDSPLDKTPQLDESNSKSTLNDLCVHQLSPLCFVVRTANGKWKLTEESRLWIESEDNLYLAALFCANVKYFSEILYYLDSPKTSRDLYDIAVNEYDMSWKVPTTINNRLVWLRAFELIEFQEFSLLYVITEKGKEFLKSVHPVMPESIVQGNDETITENDFQIETPFITYYLNNKNSVRKTGFGYFPGKLNQFDNTLSEFLTQIANDGNIDSLNKFAMEKYGIKTSSIRSATNTITSLGLIVRKSNTEYAVTDLGYTWLETQDIISLLPLFQLKYLFFIELLSELRDNNYSAKELAAFAKVSYGFDKDNVFEINNRIVVLKEAKLLMNISAEKFTLTNRGKLLLQHYEKTFCVEKAKNIEKESSSTVATDIISELRMASKDSFNPNRFEKDVRDYFSMIGFESEWLGGSGKTDILLKTTGSPLNQFVVTVDTKATSSGTVTDSLVDFDTLREHQKKHRSDYIAVVGKSFNDRLIKRAIEHHVALFDIDTLEKLLKLHHTTPQKLTTYQKIFNQSGIVDLSVLDSDITRTEVAATLIVGIMHQLIDECNDPVTHGQLSVRDLYMSLRNDPNLLTIPNTDDIKTALEFLSSPILGCVKKEKDCYFATGSIKDMAITLNHLKEKCN